MSFLVIIQNNRGSFYSESNQMHFVVDSLNDLKSLDAFDIVEVYEIKRKVAVEKKFQEEEIVIKRKPYFEIDGVKIPPKEEKESVLVLGDLTITNGTAKLKD